MIASAAGPGRHRLIYTEPAEVYHDTKAVGFHRLLNFAKDPEAFRREFIERTEKRPDTSYFLYGRKVHCRALEGEERFHADFGPDEDAATAGISASVRSNPDVADLMRTGKPEVVARCRDRATGIACQIRMDWCDPPRQLAFDLKTTKDVTRFDYDVRAYNYADQVAFYKDIYHQVVGEPLVRFPLVPASKVPGGDFIHGLPHRVGVVELPDAQVQAGHDRNRRRMEALATWLSREGLEGALAPVG